MMKVLYFNPAINSTEGAAIHARELMNGLEQAGAEVVCYPKPKPLQYAKDSIKEKEKGFILYIKETARLFRGVARSLNDYAQLRRLSKQYEFNFIFTRNFEYSIAGLMLQKIEGVPLIIEVNALQYLERKRYGNNFFIKIRKVFEKFNLEGAFGAYVVSDELINIIRKENIVPNYITSIANGVDVDKFNPDVQPMNELKSKFSGKYIFGFTGSLKAWHGTDTLVRAFSSLCKERDDVALVIVGDGDEMNNLKQLVGENNLQDRVYFAGRVNHEDVAKYLASMDVAVAPYLDNGDFYFSPLKVYEYMAAGKPVIGSRVGQLQKILAQGDYGKSVTAGSVEELTKAMNEITSNKGDLQMMSANARAEALKHSWCSVAEKVINIYRRKAA